MKIIIPGRFPGINEYTNACRNNKYAGYNIKKDSQNEILTALAAGKMQPLNKKVIIHYHYYEPNKRRDLDNISGFFHKVFQDALVVRGIISNDGWKNIKGFSDEFDVDKENPRIEVTIETAED